MQSKIQKQGPIADQYIQKDKNTVKINKNTKCYGTFFVGGASLYHLYTTLADQKLGARYTSLYPEHVRLQVMDK